METMHTVCSECLREVDAAYVVEHEAVDIRGVSVEGEFKHLICPECGERIGQLDIAGRNLDKMYRAYREKLDIPQPEEIVALRKGYGFTQRVFCLLYTSRAGASDASGVAEPLDDAVAPPASPAAL